MGDDPPLGGEQHRSAGDRTDAMRVASDAEPSLTAPFPATPVLCGDGVVPPEWIDLNDHMNIGYYMLAFDRALMRFFDLWMGLNERYVQRSGCGSFVLQSHIHYLRELRLGEPYRVDLQLLDCDAKRWHYLASLRGGLDPDAPASATCEQLAMNVDHATRRSAPLPEPERARFEQLRAAHAALPRPPQIGAPLGIRRPQGS